jgi:hypothetical protein
MNHSAKESGPSRSTKKSKKNERHNLRGEYFDVIVSSAEIKRVIVERAKHLNVDLSLIADSIGINPDSFKTKYIYAKEPKRSPTLGPIDIIDIADAIGIKIRVNCYVEPDELIDVSKFIRQDARRKTEEG